MFSAAKILVVRLGSMGDIVHALPAVASLGSAAARISWAVAPKWAPLLEGNPFVDRTVQSWRELRAESYDVAVDFQGLIKSAAVALASGAPAILGFAGPREREAAVFYTRRVEPQSTHVIARNLELVGQAATPRLVFPLPPGCPEGDLPSTPFVLASPLAGWRSKQWPLEHYAALAALLGAQNIPLVLDVPPSSTVEVAGALLHRSTLPGLIYATRRAAAVVGVDSGPLHLAAALAKPGVAIFGPTDPARNGPWGSSLHVLRSASALTTYKRRETVDDSMRRIAPEQVFEILRAKLGESA